ncbi:M50 family metallopeptidase [Actinokineospora auranticolor]|uniref:Putative peptide zinc metalloprotease protein n=1 Tax=Actinokineospora auranticolor TaxID=155976 RepID=A0A2S6GES5_9PSEU|nr:M50 family metallopeptidase [Actinokineospora auranticolor]PPK63728.1 putative peptide zinc metalloprotease protein [Actinokineospora auranticolor]
MTAAAFLDARPALRAGTELSPALIRGPVVVHLIRHPDGERSFEVGPKEHFLISRLDGTRTLAEIGAEYARRFERRLDPVGWTQLLRLLGARELLAGQGSAVAVDRSTRTEARSTVLRGKVLLVRDPDVFVGRVLRLLGPLLRPWVAVPLLLAAVAAQVVLATRVPELVADTGAVFGRPLDLVLVVVLLWFAVTAHEIGHGVVAHARGGRVGEIGLKWRLPVAIMYCRVDNYLFLLRRRDRVLAAAAGPAVNLVLLLPFVVAWCAQPTGSPTRQALSALLLLGSLQGLSNLVPLPPLDGYKMVSHALGMIDLAAESARFLGSLARRGRSVAHYPRASRGAYAAYGVGAVLVVGGLGVGLVVVSHLLWGQRIGALAVAVPVALLLFLLAGSITRWVRARRAGAARPSGPRGNG